MGRLTQYGRERIEHYARRGWGIRQIARYIGRDHSVVGRELQRNRSPHFAYEAARAETFARRRASQTNRRKLEKSKALRDYVRTRLRDRWSPEQIAGRLKLAPPEELAGLRVSYEAIYQWVYDEAKGEPWLYHQLCRKHYVRRRKSQRRRHKVLLKQVVAVAQRPETTTLGYFEIDSIVGRRHKSALSVHYERTSQLVKIWPLVNLSASETKAALEATLAELATGLVKSFTFDRGSETAEHYQLRQPYRLKTYHCDPYKPYQKGGVENINGLIRQYLSR